MRSVLVGDVLKRQRREVKIKPTGLYTLIGVLSFGKGIFHRQPQLGIDLGNYRFSSVEPGDLVISNIQAWEGAIAFATESERGTVGTNRFLTYRARDSNCIDENWARYYLLSPPGFEKIQRAAPGSVTRNRTLAIERFEAIEIPLPKIEEQHRVAAHLDLVTSITTRIRAASADAPDRLAGSAQASVQALMDAGVSEGWPIHRLGAVATINPRRTKVDPEEPVAFVPMRCVDAATGRIADFEPKTAAEVKSGYKQFERGDVIFARITPCMQNGKSAIVTDDLPPVGFGSTEFHVIRPGPRVSAEWIHAVVRTRDFKLAAAERFTGTAGQQRVPADFLEKVEIPVPPTAADQQRVLDQINRITSLSLSLRDEMQRRDAIASAILPAALNEAFAGLS